MVACQSHQDASRFLSSALGHANGIALLQGPTGSGKTTVLKQQLAWSSRDASVALVEGSHLTPDRLVTETLSQFGVQTASEDPGLLMQKLQHFVTEQTRFKHAPVLIIDNADRTTASALRLLNWLAALETHGNYAMRIVLTGDEGLQTLSRRAGMQGLARRHPAMYSLNPLTEQETMIYLRTRLIAAGGENSEKVFPIDICQRLHELSRGWPGALNAHAIEVVEHAVEEVSATPLPRIIVTRDGETVAEYELSERQYIIGRSRMADILIEDGHASRLHALLYVQADAVILADLNSTNGTTVNSRIVNTRVLKDNDVIMLGGHRIKIENVPAITADVDEPFNPTATITLQSTDDLRQLRARRTLSLLKQR